MSNRMTRIMRYQNHKAYPCHLANNDLEKQLPLKFVEFSQLLAKAQTGFIKEDDVGFACNIIAKLASYEGMGMGYYCAFKGSVLAPKNNGDRGVYLIKYCMITCQKHKMEEIKNEIEKQFFDKYKIRIRLELCQNSQDCESFLYTDHRPSTS